MISATASLEPLLNRSRDVLVRPRPPLPPDQQAQTRELRRKIERGIARLPKKYRQVFVLADMNKMSTAEIAGALDIKMGTSRPGSTERGAAAHLLDTLSRLLNVGRHSVAAFFFPRRSRGLHCEWSC